MMQRKILNYSLFALLFLSIFSCSNNDENTTVSNEPSNQEKALAVMLSLGSPYDKTPATQWMNVDYIQHNLGGYTGQQGFFGLVDYAKSVNATSKNYRLFTDGDYVFAHHAYKFNPNAAPFPVFDVFRFENGKLAEHWDNIAYYAGAETVSPINGNTMTDGGTILKDENKTTANKNFISQYILNVSIGGATNYSNYYTSNFVQHHPELENGITGLQNGSNILAKSKYQSLFKVLGQGNFILTMCKGQYNDGTGFKDAGLYDLFRVENGKIIEQWSNWEIIPPQSQWANQNGKF